MTVSLFDLFMMMMLLFHFGSHKLIAKFVIDRLLVALDYFLVGSNRRGMSVFVMFKGLFLLVGVFTALCLFLSATTTTTTTLQRKH